jgi:transcriptional regulator with XRE-family HTH domain
VIATFFTAQHSRGMSPAASDPRIPREMYPDKIGARMRLIREAYGLKPAEIADMLDIERTYWSRFEGGRRAINDEVAYLLVEKFNVTLDFLMLGRWDTLRVDVAEKLRAAAKLSAAN